MPEILKSCSRILLVRGSCPKFLENFLFQNSEWSGKSNTMTTMKLRPQKLNEIELLRAHNRVKIF